MAPLTLQLPDGRVVRSDVPPPHVARALRQFQVCRMTRRPLDRRSLALIFGWLEQQERRYPTAPARRP